MRGTILLLPLNARRMRICSSGTFRQPKSELRTETRDTFYNYELAGNGLFSPKLTFDFDLHILLVLSCVLARTHTRICFRFSIIVC